MFEPLWTRQYIRNVQARVARGGAGGGEREGAGGDPQRVQAGGVFVLRPSVLWRWAGELLSLAHTHIHISPSHPTNLLPKPSSPTPKPLQNPSKTPTKTNPSCAGHLLGELWHRGAGGLLRPVRHHTRRHTEPPAAGASVLLALTAAQLGGRGRRMIHFGRTEAHTARPHCARSLTLPLLQPPQPYPPTTDPGSLRHGAAGVAGRGGHPQREGARCGAERSGRRGVARRAGRGRAGREGAWEALGGTRQPPSIFPPLEPL